MKNELIKRIFSSIFLLPIVIFIIFKGEFYFNIFLIICLIISFYEWNYIVKKNFFKTLGFLFLIISFYSIYRLRNESNVDYVYIYFVLIISVATDLGGYIFGKIFKGPKLTKISPNKTYSGVLGSYFISFILSSIYFYFFKHYFIKNSFIEILIIVFLISTISQLGDLTLSYFKRLSNLKDTGNLIPGHGGILDRIDGIIFAFPAFYFLTFINIFKQ